MLLINCALDSSMDLSCWYERVASESNIADDPSRLCFDELVELGSEQCVVTHPASIVEWKAKLIGIGS